MLELPNGMKIPSQERNHPFLRNIFNTHNPPYHSRQRLLVGACATVALNPSILSAAKSLQHHSARTQIDDVRIVVDLPDVAMGLGCWVSIPCYGLTAWSRPKSLLAGAASLTGIVSLPDTRKNLDSLADSNQDFSTTKGNKITPITNNYET